MNILHAECFERGLLQDDWWSQVNQHSLGWVCMRHSGRLAGSVNVAWDGGVHAFLLNTLVTTSMRRRGYATTIVKEAIRHARASGCEWLHVDFEPHLAGFYYEACGFRPTEAGVIPLR